MNRRQNQELSTVNPSLSPSLSKQVAEELAGRILRQILQPGHQLIESEIADEMGISRSPVREAIQLLDSDGLVERRPRKPAVVAHFNVPEFRQLYELRSLIEGYAVTLATPYLDAAVARHYSDAMATAFAEADEDAFAINNQAFHEYLYQACPNGAMRDEITRLWNRTERFRGMVRRTPNRMKQSLDTHEEICRAIETSQPELAGNLVSRLLYKSNDDVANAFHTTSDSDQTIL